MKNQEPISAQVAKKTHHRKPSAQTQRERPAAFDIVDTEGVATFLSIRGHDERRFAEELRERHAQRMFD